MSDINMNEQRFQLLLEMAFVMYVTEEHHKDPDFPDINRVTTLVATLIEKIIDNPHAAENTTVKDMLAVIMQKHGV